MNRGPNRLFLTFLIGFSVSAAALILTIPAIFGPHEPQQAMLTMILGAVTAILAVGALLLRPRRHGVAD